MNLLLALLLTASASPEVWVVKTGDTCANIAARAYGDSREYQRLHRLNPGMGMAPHSLVEGQVLRLVAVPTATVSYVLPAVRARTETHREWLSATLGQSLFRHDEVSTLKQAAASLVFRDQTHLILRENALVVISDDLFRTERNGGPTLELISGSTRLRLADLRAPSLEMRSEGVSIKHGPGEVLVEVDTVKTNRISVHRGSTTVTAKGQHVTVAAGQGTVVPRAKAPEAPRPLPDAPSGFTVPAVVLRSSIEVSWLASANAVQYRLEASRDEAFEQPSYEVTTTALRHLVTLEPGVSYLRVSASDAAGLWSIPSVAARIDVVALSPLPETGSARLSFEGLSNELHVVLDGVRDLPTPMVVDQPGAHRLEIVGERGHDSLEFTVRPPLAKLERTEDGLVVTSENDASDFVVTRDEEMTPAALTEVEGHRWRLWWHGALVDEAVVEKKVVTPALEKVQSAQPSMNDAPPMLTSVLVRDRGVGRLTSLTPWVSPARLEVQLGGTTSPEASLALRHESAFGTRVSLMAGVVGSLGSANSFDVSVGAKALLVEAGVFRLGLGAQGALQLAPTLLFRARAGPSVGVRLSTLAASADGSVELDATGQLAAHAGLQLWVELEPTWAFTAQADFWGRAQTRDVMLGGGLEHRFGALSGAAILTYQTSTFTPGLACQMRWE